MTALSLDAPAKVNLQLAVTGRRDDGYHLLDSLVVFAGLSDRVSLRESNETRVVGVGRPLERFAASTRPGNTVELAIRAFGDATGTGKSYLAEIEKRIPVAAGLGGGSADAAAALVLLNRINDNPLDSDGLDRVALGIGADVPVCLRAHAGDAAGWRMRGIGEELERVGLPDGLGLVLVNDGDAVSTGTVFEAFDAPDAEPREPGDIPDPCGLAGLRDRIALGNDLLGPALAASPNIANTLEAVGRASDLEGFIGGGMSGSGATCFALFETRAEAEAAAATVGEGRRWCWSGGLAGGGPERQP